MKNLKQLFTYITAGVLAITSLTFSSCDDDENPTFADPTVVIAQSTINAGRGQTVTIPVAVTAEAGLASVKVNGTEIKSYSTKTTTDVVSYEHAVAADAPSGNTVLTFEVSDMQSPAKTVTQAVTITVSGKQTIEVTGAITSNTTWSAANYYLIKGNVYVQAPAELTIEAGTVIFGDKVSKGALIINRGAKIHAVGTAAAPIVFTSAAPVNFRNYGDWGGVVVLGKAINNQSENQTIEGVTGTAGDDGKYGGTADDDDSGEIQYVRIEFAGIALSTDNELNGLTLGSVGSNTDIHHVQVSYSGDDSFEWFGGKVSAQYLIAYRGWDDDFDTDFGYTGNVQYAVSHRDPNIADKSGSNGFESDNDGSGSAKTPLTAPKFSNVSWFGPGVYARLSSGALNKSNYNANYQFGAHVRRNTAIQIYNSVFLGSYLEGVHFDKTNPAAVFKGNYFGRTAIGASTAGNTRKQTVKDATAGFNPANDFDAATFDTDNRLESSQATVDLSTVFTGLVASNISVDQPLSVLAASSALLTGAATVPAGLTQTTYAGAFDGTTNWTSETWVNFAPGSTQY